MTVHDAVAAADWDTIWQSELAALAVDRENQERFVLWGQAWIAAGAVAGDAAGGHAGADAATGAAAAGLAPDADQVERQLRAMLAGFERQHRP